MSNKAIMFTYGSTLLAVFLAGVISGPIGMGIVGFIGVVILVVAHRMKDEREEQFGEPDIFGSPIPWAEPEQTRTASDSQLPEHRPCVIPAEYGQDPKGILLGLFVTNPGYMALDIQIPSVALASSGYTLEFPETLPQLGERDHRCFMTVWLNHPTLPGRTGSDLFDVMRSFAIESLPFAIHYKDLKSLWYKSNCTIERDVMVKGGIRVSFVKQELLREEVWEEAGLSGPRILLSWNYPPEAAYPGLGITHKILTIENPSATEDAFDVRLEDISLSVTNRLSASFEPIERVPIGTRLQAGVILKGNVPHDHQGELQMIYFAADKLHPQFEELTEDGEPKLVRFPMVVRFKDYSGTRYRARFEFTDDMLADKQQIAFVGREKLIMQR